jgi:NADH-quinone oxidoreductase subunit L
MDPQTLQTTGLTLKWLLTIAWLLPLLGFVVELIGGGWVWGRYSKNAAYLSVICIVTGFICSFTALMTWGNQTNWSALKEHGAAHGDAHGETPAHAGEAAAHGAAKPEAAHGHDEHSKSDPHAAKPDAAKKDDHAKHDEHAKPVDHGAANDGHGDGHHTAPKVVFSGIFYRLAQFGSLDISLSYYIDSLTLVMFTMVTFIASCIHIFAIGYMSEELTDNYADHQVHTSHGHLHRPGRFHRFFSFLSLFCFSMLGLVLAGNIFQVFIFWELVGVCSYFLIGFYTERKSASTAANKAFIMNRVGDFGFLIGLMIVWTWFGNFQFGDMPVGGHTQPGLFSMVRGNDGQMKLHVPESGRAEVVFKNQDNHVQTKPNGEQRTIPYWLLVAAGLGVFGGCIGKSAQFPLQTWLPDAMEGPTPVSALVHSATMVAAGVYLVGRFYPMFTPEVLLTIAYIGAITLFMAATIAVVATDIKKVLAYSTISQLGYMMLGLGLGGWAAGLFHLITHAFFKSLMFLASGSVIYGCHHVQEMPQMGGLRRKMPITAYTMLVGVIAIAGLAIPYVTLPGGEPIAFSGYHSKDAIVATALTYMKLNGHYLLFFLPLAGAGITAFYMFRLWFYTFAGEPRDHEVYEHAHESPWVMVGPLVVLSFFAAFCAFGGESGILFKLLLDSEPSSVAGGYVAQTEYLGQGLLNLKLPSHAAIHANHAQAGTLALIVAFAGAACAYVVYGVRWVNAAEIKQQFSGIHRFLVNKWGFDEFYDMLFVRPTHVVAGWCSAIDRVVFDGFLHATAKAALKVSDWDRQFDETIVDGAVNTVGTWTYAIGRSLSVVQTGRMRNYVMFIAVGLLGIFALLIMFFPN